MSAVPNSEAAVAWPVVAGIKNRGALPMAKSGTLQPTEVELQILRILWELGPSRVRDIHARLNAEKGTNYSTTVKMLSVMLEKGIVRRDEAASPHVYRAALSREKAGKRMLSDLIERVYDGAAMSLVLEALGNTTATKEELDEARRLLDRMEKKNP
ncbi:MAG TPA: BlaI/MecI/CopY family transcriptional regulator [Pirellulales bacterium]|jgi:predicted transcriptional regulator|nr:BlaI/MecI/CopY family transcriptional regulator [Pirellulales bacterium]